MIRFAEQADTPAVIALWDRCFGEDPDFNHWFFAHRYRAEDTLLYWDGSTLCAMVQMLPYRYRTEQGESEVTYIYGACTAPEYRRQGRMAELLQESFRIDELRGRTASVLIPAEPWLFDFYKQFGYETAFYLDNREVHRNSDRTYSGSLRPLESSDIPGLDELYRRCISGPCLLRSPADWQDQLTMFHDLGGRALGWLDEGGILRGYAFLWQSEKGLTVQEILSEQTETMMQFILRYCSAESAKYTTFGGQSPLGCLRPHADTPVVAGYFNLLFN
ncbi:MAG: GNAT family N-acetyltransferase [Butyricicoccus sp.]